METAGVRSDVPVVLGEEGRKRWEDEIDDWVVDLLLFPIREEEVLESDAGMKAAGEGKEMGNDVTRTVIPSGSVGNRGIEGELGVLETAANTQSMKEPEESIWTPSTENISRTESGQSAQDSLSPTFPFTDSHSYSISDDFKKNTHEDKFIIEPQRRQVVTVKEIKSRRKGRKPNPIQCFFCQEIAPYKRDFIQHLRVVHGIQKSQSLLYKRLREGSEAIKQRYCKPKVVFAVTLVR